MTRRALAVPLGAAAALLIVAAAAPALGERLALAQWAQALPEAVAALACALAARHVEAAERAVWVLFAAALATWALTDAAYGATLMTGLEPPEVGVFDVGWMLFYVPVLAGLLLAYRRYRPERGWQGALDGAVLCLALGLVTWKLALAPVAGEGGGGAVGTAVNLAYPVLDATGLMVAIWLLGRHGVRVPAWVVLAAAAFGLQAAGNLAHLVAALNGVAIADWLSAATFALAGAVWVQAARTRRRSPPAEARAARSAPPPWTQAVPFALVGVLAAVLIVDDSPGVIGVGALALLLAGARVVGTLSVNSRLIAEQARYRSLFIAMAEGVLLQDATGAVVASNPAAERILGAPAETLQSESRLPPGWRAIDETGQPLPRERFPGALTLATGAPCRGIVMGLERPDGTVRWLSVAGEPVPGPSGSLQGAVVTFVDVTEERAAQAALRRERDFTATMLQSLNDGLSVVDAERRITLVNDRLCEMTGFSREELVGATPPFPYHIDAPAPDSWLARMLDPATRGEADVVLRTKDGGTITVVVSAAPLWDGERLVGGVRVYKDITERRRAERDLRRSEASHRELAAQMATLHRVATAVADEREPRLVHDLVAREALGLLGADEVQVLRFRGTVRADVMGAASASATPEVETGMALMLGRDGAAARVARSGHPAGVAREDEQAAAAPVVVAGETWGAVVATARGARRLPPGVATILGPLGELAGLAVHNHQTRSKLAALATSDPLTGLSNHRAFHERLLQEAAVADRHARPLSLIVLDIDHFKRVNDRHGHQAGDLVLRRLAACAAGMVRSGELLGRVGGEEFAWILPQTDLAGALAAAERLRRAVAATPFERVGQLTISGGVAQLQPGGSAADLFAAADEGLYRAKALGRNRCEAGGLLDAPPEPAPALA